MKILVTGAGGFVGGALCEFLEGAGQDVIPVFRSGPESGHPLRSRAVVCDLSKAEEVSQLPPAEAVVHAAAKMRGGATELWCSNVESTRHLCDYAVKHGTHRFLLFSSGAVYGYRKAQASLETDPLKPIGFYGFTKAIAETTCDAYRENFGLATSCLRLFFPYGENQKSGLVTNLISAVKTSSPVHQGHHGGPVLSLTHILDVSSAVLELLTTPKLAPIYNLCSDESLSIAEIVKQIENSLNTTAAINRVESQTGDLIANNSLLKRDTPWRPKHTLSSTVNKLIYAEPIQTN
jgi:UDP-glucose 4-epimerase